VPSAAPSPNRDPGSAARRPTTVKFLDKIDEKGVLERRFDVSCDGRSVPGILWTPSAPETLEPRPLVLMGHGALTDKRVPYLVSLARRLVRHHGIAAASIDHPEHGDRDRPDHAGAGREPWWSHTTTDETVADWHAVVAGVQALDEVGAGPLGYFGMSQGTIFGLPFVASEPRVQVAALGLMGIAGPTSDRIAADAARITCPVLFLVQWDDELFPRDRAFDLFTALASTDKRLHAHPGSHGAVALEELEFAESFLAAHLLRT
jgi:dienelactone hydrolase